MKHLYASCLLLAALTACRHHEAEPAGPDLTGRYTLATTVTAPTPIRMYTQAGLVGDAAITTRFLARRKWASSYFSATDVSYSSSYTHTLTFRDGGRYATLRATSASATDSVRTEVTDLHADSFLLQNLDSLDGAPIPPGQDPCTRVAGLIDYIRGAKAGAKCGTGLSQGSYVQECRYRPVRVVRVRDHQLYVPFYSWLVQAQGCYTAVSGEWNTFNPAVLSQLTAGDTIVVQEREVALHR